MDWRLDGHVLIACNCDWGCPCNFNAPPSRGKCEGGWIWVIAQGHLEGVEVDGLAVALYSDWPGAIHEGGGRAVAYMDDRANEAQRVALTRLVRGELGGPWGIFIRTYQLTGPHPASFDLEVAGYDTRVTIGDAVELELTKIRNPVTQAEAHPEMVLPEGIVTKRGHLAASKVFRVRDELGFDHSGQYAAFGPFHYES
jgi:hypothetical protein